MKTPLLLISLFLISTLFSSNLPAQDYTKWDLPEGAITRLGKGTISSIMFSPDGKRLAVASSIGIWIYNAQTGKELNRLARDMVSGVYSMCFSPDGRILASGSLTNAFTSSSGDYVIRLWSTSTGQHIKTLIGHTAPVISVHFSPDGKKLASGSIDKTVRLWSVSTGQHLKTLIGHTDWITSVCFSPDGHVLASGSGGGLNTDRTIRWWSVSTGQDCAYTLTRHTETVRKCMFITGWTVFCKRE